MPHTFEPLEEAVDGPHRWLVTNCSQDPERATALTERMVDAARRAYGEADLLAIAEPEPDVVSRFNLEALVAGFRLGMPDPEAESAKKPAWLRNDRSEMAELITREVLAELCAIRFPASPQSVKLNSNQPILGFDGWGLIDRNDGSTALVLVLVKGTEDVAIPPDVAATLIAECSAADTNDSAISRALSVLVKLLSGTDDAQKLLGMLERLGDGQRIALVLGPTIVRGHHASDMLDLATLRAYAQGQTTPIVGTSLSVQQDLGDLGTAVFTKARAA